MTGALTESLDNLGVNGENVMIRESLTQLTSNDASGYIVFLREFDGNEKNTVKSFLRELAYFRKLVNTERERVTVFLCRVISSIRYMAGTGLKQSELEENL